MTYWQFHLVFILPVLLLLALLPPRPLAEPEAGRKRAFLLLLAVIAFGYTTPWDNYLVYRGVWGYGSERVLATIGWVPVEEYLFFLLQPLLTGLWFYRLRARWRPARMAPADLPTFWPIDGAPRANYMGAGLLAAAATAGLVLLGWEPGVYLGLILVWAAPVLALQWLLGGAHFLAYGRLWFWSFAAPTLYLWVADRLAIGAGIWTIAEETTLGWHLFGLPVEEAVFFLVTNLLVVQGLMLFLPLPARRMR